MAIGVHELAAMSERRIERLVNPGLFLNFCLFVWVSLYLSLFISLSLSLSLRLSLSLSLYLSVSLLYKLYPAKAADFLAIGVHKFAAMSERKIERLVNPGFFVYVCVLSLSLPLSFSLSLSLTLSHSHTHYLYSPY